MNQRVAKMLVPQLAAFAMFILPVIPSQQLRSPESYLSRTNPKAVAISDDECFCATEEAAEYFESQAAGGSVYLTPQPLSGLAGLSRLFEQSA